MHSNRIFILICIVVFTVTGCATPGGRSVHLAGVSTQCEPLLRSLNHQIELNNLRSDRAHLVDDLPWLRVDRFIASFDLTLLTVAESEVWYRYASEIGKDDFLQEIQLLNPATSLAEISNCIDQQIAQLQSIDWKKSLSAKVAVPDSYKMISRWLGVYPVSSFLAGPSIRNYREGMLALMAETSSFEVSNTFVLDREAIEHSPVNFPLPRDALRIPVLKTEDMAALFARHAPKLQVEYATKNDLPGTLQSVNGEFVVDTEKATFYTYPSYTRYNGDVLLQLNYAFWFPARTAEKKVDFYAGPLDGIIWRVTLAENGDVAWFDSIHQCGCYHKIYLPDDDYRLQENIHGERPVAVYVPSSLKSLTPMLKIRGGDHYIVTVQEPQGLFRNPMSYSMQDYETLNAIDSSSGFVSLFAERGLVPQSQRLERFTLWPLGIENAGAMRQRGQHAIAFIGKRHFDDAFLFEALLTQEKNQFGEPIGSTTGFLETD